MRNILLVFTFILLFFPNLISQSEPESMMVDWQVGTEKTITQLDSMIVFINDTVMMATGSKVQYNMKVESLVDTVYTIRFKQMVISEDFLLESAIINVSPVLALMQKLIHDLQNEMQDLEYSFLVSKNSAYAYEILNEEKLMNHIEKIMFVVLNQMIEDYKIVLTEDEKNEMEIKLKTMMKEQMPDAMQTVLNSFNYIFQSYALPFVLNENYNYESTFYDIDVLESKGDQTGSLSIDSHKKGSTLTIDYDYLYDKEEAYQMYIIDGGRGEEVSRDDFDIKEQVVTNFNLDSSWLLNSTSIIEVVMDMVVVTNNTYVIVK